MIFRSGLLDAISLSCIPALTLPVLPSACSKAPDSSSDADSPDQEEATEGQKSITFIDRSFDPNIPTPPKDKPEETEKKENQPFEFKGDEGSVAADILAMEEGSAQFLAMEALMSQWIQYDPEGAFKFGDTLGDNLQLKRAYHKGTAPHLAKDSPEMLLSIIEDGNWWPDQWRVERDALRRVAEEDLDRATRFFADTSKGKQLKLEALRFSRRIASEQSPAAAINFIAELENEDARNWATRGLVQEWIASDMDEAVGYVNRLGDQATKDQGALGVVDAVWKSNPEDAVVWASAIKDRNLRQKTYSNLATAWQRRGEDGFINAMLANRKLSNAEISAVREALAQTKK